MNTRIRHTPRIAATALLALLALMASNARAEDDGDPLDRFVITYDYARRTTEPVPERGPYYQDLGTTRTSSQDIHAVGFHGVLWRPQNQTLQGHLPALGLDAQLGWFMEDEAQSPGEETGGLLFSTKTHCPWSLVDLGWLRAGAGFGFGIAYELGSADPRTQEWHGIDFDLTANAIVQLDLPGGIGLSAVYENAFFGVMYDSQHRLRVMADWSWFSLGVDGRVTDMGGGASYTQFGASAGFKVL